MMFSNESINIDALKHKAFNGRWATVLDGVIPLTAADPDFPIASEITEGVIKYLQDGYLSYGPFSGLEVFKLQVAAFFNARKNGCFEPENVVAINSAAQGMYLIAKYLLKPGDEVIIFDPVDFLFKKTVEICGAKVQCCPIDYQTGQIDFDHLQSYINPKTKLISICNPHNPYGKILGYAELKKIASIAEKHDLWVMSDEIWSDILYEKATFTTYSSVSDYAAQKSFTVYGFSKSFGLAGLRIGAVLCKNQVVLDDFIEKSQFNSTIEGVATLSQIAASVALDKGLDWLALFLKHLESNRDFAVASINRSALLQTTIPEATYVIFPEIKNEYTSESFVHQALDVGKVALVPGSERWFGTRASGHVRICFATSRAILEEGLERIYKSF